MRLLASDYLIPSHTRPVIGAKEIDTLFGIYRDAVLFVHDQTVRLMNRGYFLEDIVTSVTLPPHLLEHPYLQEYYGTVEWSVRGIFTTYLGWFSGDPALLHPLRPLEQAERMVTLAGGAEELLDCSLKSVEKQDYQWGLVCAQSVMRYSEKHTESTCLQDRSRELMLRCLHGLAEKEVSANGRNYYLTYALELSKQIENLQPSRKIRNAVIKSMSGVDIIKMLPIRLDAEKAASVDMRVMYVAQICS